MALYQKQLAESVKYFWRTRSAQAKRQGAVTGRKDYGNRAATTGGGHMAGFCQLILDELVKSGISPDTIYIKAKRELPGFFRPQKQWDLAVVIGRQLGVVIEVKSQVGSFGNNANNRTEEAIGAATDFWTAYREGVFLVSPRPWLGYLMLVEDSQKSRTPIKVAEPHFKVLEEFRGASYVKRYELLFLRLIRERLYDSACLLVSPERDGRLGRYTEPCFELTFERFVAALTTYAAGAAALARQARSVVPPRPQPPRLPPVRPPSQKPAN